MKKGTKYVAAALVGAVSLTGAAAIYAQQQQISDKPLRENWGSEWGPDDKIGAANRITPQVVMRALKLVKQGKVATLGKLYASDIPAFGARSWSQIYPGTPAGGPFGGNALVYNEEFVSTEIGQYSTQFDGPGHIGVRTSKGDIYYGGRTADQIYQRGPGGRLLGMGPNGVEFIGEKGFVCRGIVLDGPGYKGVKRLRTPDSATAPGIITADDVRGMLKRQNLSDIQEGDCVFIYTGHGDLWLNDEWKSLPPEEKAKRRQEFNDGEPGWGISACDYLATRKPAMTGGDAWSNDAEPWKEDGKGKYANYCHTELQTRRGIWNLENLEFTPLLKDRAYEFMFVWSPLKIVGGTGSPGNPVAIY